MLKSPLLEFCRTPLRSFYIIGKKLLINMGTNLIFYFDLYNYTEQIYRLSFYLFLRSFIDFVQFFCNFACF